jgi:hypothetical protein
MTTTTMTPATPHSVNDQARRAWGRLARAETFEAASAALAPRPGSAGWAARWAAASAAKIADMAAATKAEIAAERDAAR